MIECSGAKALLKSLEYESVEYIFGYPGGAIMPVYDALMLEEYPFRHILMRHEQGAIHAAQGYTRAHPKGKPGVCFATSGPGATNLITGLADAFIDNTAIVCITGQVASTLLGTDAFQETDIINISAPVTKWNYRIERASEVASAVAHAFYIACSGKPGPVLLDFTKDAQTEKCAFSYSKSTSYPRYYTSPQKSTIEDNTQNISLAARLINEAQKPFMLIGQGVALANAGDEIIALGEKADIPFASTLLGLSCAPSDHPLNKGMLGMHGHLAPNLMTQECDLLIAIGMRFDDRVTSSTAGYAPKAKIIHFDIDPAEINKIIRIDVPIIGDCKKMLQELLPLVKNKKANPYWEQQYKEWETSEKECLIDDIRHSKGKNLRMGEVVFHVNECLKKPTTIVTDVGQHQMTASRYFNFTSAKTQITSGGLGTMGFALPASIGAALANPKNLTIAIIGDGGFQMTIQELGVIAQYKIPIKILIFNNNFLGMVRQWQELFFEKRYSSTNLANPDFVKIAEAYGIDAVKIASRKDLKELLPRYLSTDKAALMEIVVEKEENVYPMVPSGASLDDIFIPSLTVTAKSNTNTDK